MLAYLVLVLAALSRLVPHAFHGVGINITAVGGGLLFFGSRRSRWEAASGAAVMALTDIYLTRYVFGLPFHLHAYAVTWLWYAGVCLLGSTILARTSTLRLLLAVFSSATGFFLLSNFMVWAGGVMYPRTTAGLASCYAAGLPFYGNDLVSTGLTAGMLFGLPLAAQFLVRSLQGAPGRQPLA